MRKSLHNRHGGLQNVAVLTLTAFAGSLVMPAMAEAANTPVGVRVAYAAELSATANALAESATFLAPPDLSSLIGKMPELLDPASLVNARNGNVLFTETDLVLPSESSVTISLERTWNAFDPQASGLFGLGWKTPFEVSIAADSRGDLRVTEPDGYVVTFSKDGADPKKARARISRDIAQAVRREHEASGKVQSDEYYGRLAERLAVDDSYFLEHRDLHPSAGRVPGYGVFHSVERGRQTVTARPQGWTRRLADGSSQVFDKAGRLVRIGAAAGGAQLRVLRAGNGTIQGLVDEATSRSIRFGYDKAGRVVTARDAVDREYRYTYDQEGHLLQVGRPDMRGTSYDWAGDSLSLVTRADGSTISFTYDADGRAAKISGPGLRSASFDYEFLSTAPPKSLTKITDSTGATRSIGWDEKDGTVTETDAMGGTRITWFGASGPASGGSAPQAGANGLPVKMRDVMGNVATFEYDARGNLVRERDGAGRVTTTKFDANDRAVWRTSPDGRETTWAWDALGNVVDERSSGGVRTASRFDAAGRLIATQDATGATTKYGWDRFGNLVSETGAEGATLRREVDAAGRVLSETDARGGVMRYDYDRAGNLLSVTDASGRVTRYGWDLMGRMIGLSRVGSPEMTIKWSAAGRPEKLQTAGAPGAWNLAWDSEGRLTKMTAPNGAEWSLAHDALGRTTAITDPLGHKTSYEYDAAGRVIAQTLPGGVRETFEFDAGGRLIRRTNAAARVRVAFTYDAADRVTSVTNPMMAVTRFDYDAAGRLSRIVDADGKAHTFAYDGAGRRTSYVNAKGVTTKWSYDRAGNLAGLSDPGASIRLLRDDTGDVTGLATNDGTQLHFVRDPAGNITEIKNAKSGRVVRFRRDAASRVTGMDAPIGLFEYDYDAAGRVTKVAGPDGADLWKYDGMGNPVEHRDAAGRTTTWTYDLRGERTSTTKLEGRAAETWRYERDALGRAAAFTDPSGRRTTFQYDAAGNLVKAGDPAGTQASYEYDAAGQLIGAPLSSGGRGRFQYSPAGAPLGVEKQESQAATPKPKLRSSLLPELLPGDRFADAGGDDTLYASLGALAPAGAVGRVDSGNRRGTLNGAVVNTKQGPTDGNGGVPGNNPGDPNDPNNQGQQGQGPGEILKQVMDAIQTIKDLFGGGGGGGGGKSGGGGGGGGQQSGGGGGGGGQQSGGGGGGGGQQNGGASQRGGQNGAQMPNDAATPNGPVDMQQLMANLQELTDPNMKIPGVGDMVAKAMGELVLGQLMALAELMKALARGDIGGIVKAFGMMRDAMKKFETAIKQIVAVKRMIEALSGMRDLAADTGRRVRQALGSQGRNGLPARALSVGKARATFGRDADDAAPAGWSSN